MNDEAGIKPTVEFESFAALDLRVGVVLGCVAFPEARIPAWKLSVDFGPAVGVLQTSAQVQHYTSEELVGRTVIGAINLGERRIAGFRSQFLLLGAVTEQGIVKLLEIADAPPGSSVH